jgi:hypothetical protein
MLQDKYILRGELFSQFSTLKGNIFLVSERSDDVRVLRALQQMELVSQVTHCLGIFYTYHLQHHL